MEEKESKWKKIIGPILAEVIPVLIKQATEGKTKLGVYLLGIFSLSMTFFIGGEAGDQITIGTDIVLKSSPNIPAVFKLIGGAGARALGIGVAHDLVKRTKGGIELFKAIRSRFKNPF